MTSKAALLNVMSQHQGREAGICAAALAAKLGMPTRSLRKLISRCRQDDGIAICGQPSAGYFMAQTPDELQQSCEFLQHRALHSLAALSRMKQVSLPDLLGQLKLNQA